ncbi:MAG: GMP reductase [Bifidobacteriaceae bacterium]|nr:GMP reductase [Bifidobacteriaceae bacterium]
MEGNNLAKYVNTFDYDNMRLIARKSIVSSRSMCDTSFQIGGFKFNLPIVPANMKSVVNAELAVELAKRGFFYIMHRFEIMEKSLDFVKKVFEINKTLENPLPISVSIGVKKESYDFLKSCSKFGYNLDFITLDIAHAHSDAAKDMVKFSRSIFPESFIIAGNIMTPEAADWLIDAGADCVKLGLGPGSVCTTKLDTGFGSAQWQAYCIKLVSSHIQKKYKRKIYICADGGIKLRGDVAKALAVGADFIMAGGRLAGFDESPGTIIQDNNGAIWKAYYGSASAENKNEKKHIEGRHTLVHLKGSIWDELQAQTEALRSSISYAGGKDLSVFQDVEFAVV